MSAIASLLEDYMPREVFRVRVEPAPAKLLRKPSSSWRRIAAQRPIQTTVAHELADIVLAAAVVADHYGFTVEDAIPKKTELDTGRELRVE